MNKQRNKQQKFTSTRTTPAQYTSLCMFYPRMHQCFLLTASARLHTCLRLGTASPHRSKHSTQKVLWRSDRAANLYTYWRYLSHT
jgi:hypothetical protein